MSNLATVAAATSLVLPPQLVELVGSIAAVCTTASLIPQLVRVWQRKSAHDISLGMFTTFSIGILLWMIYGFLLASRPMEVANAVTLIFSLTILVLKLRYDRR